MKMRIVYYSLHGLIVLSLLLYLFLALPTSRNPVFLQEAEPSRFLFVTYENVVGGPTEREIVYHSEVAADSGFQNMLFSDSDYPPNAAGPAGSKTMSYRTRLDPEELYFRPPVVYEKSDLGPVSAAVTLGEETVFLLNGEAWLTLPPIVFEDGKAKVIDLDFEIAEGAAAYPNEISIFLENGMELPTIAMRVDISSSGNVVYLKQDTSPNPTTPEMMEGAVVVLDDIRVRVEEESFPMTITELE